MGGSCRQVPGWLKGYRFSRCLEEGILVPRGSPRKICDEGRPANTEIGCAGSFRRAAGVIRGCSEWNADIQQDRHIVDFSAAVHVDGIGGQLQANRDTLIDEFQAGNEVKSVTPIRQVVF